MFPSLTGGNNNAAARTPVNTKGLGRDNQFTGGGPIATQNLGGNSLTQMMRSLQNYQTTQGAQTFGQGQDITNAALPGFGVAGDTATAGRGFADTAMGTTGTAMDTTRTAMDTTGTAMDTTKRASAALDPAESYWTKLLSGDQATMNQAISPYATQAAQNYGNAVTQVGQNMPRGGYSAALQSQMPFAQARDVNEQLYKLQPQAAAGLNTVAGTRGQIGGVQGNIAGTQGQIGGTQGQIASVQGQLANILGNLGLNQAQIAKMLADVGIDTSKLGLGLLDQGSTSLTTGRGQDVGEHGQAMQMGTTLAQQLMKDMDPAAAKHI
jgi:hypothetical protein